MVSILMANSLSLVIIRNHFILTEELDKVQMRGHHLTLHLPKCKNIRSLISFYIFVADGHNFKNKSMHYSLPFYFTFKIC